MKAKLFMFLMAIGLFLAMPTFTYAQGYTDEDIEMEGSDVGNSDFGPVSYHPDLLEAVVSHINQTINLNFLEDLGTVTIWIVDEAGQLYISEEINTTKDNKVTIDIKALPGQKYTLICYNAIENQKGKFELHK